MQIILDKYGILVNGQALQGNLQLIHPTSSTEFECKRTPEYDGPSPLFTNILVLKCSNTFYGRWRLLYNLSKWLFLRSFNVQETSASTGE